MALDEVTKLTAKLAKVRSDAERIIYLLNIHRRQCYRSDQLSAAQSVAQNMIKEIEEP